MNIRSAIKSDAQSLLTLLSKLDAETDYMLFEPGERQTTLAQQEAILDRFADGRGVFLVAESEHIEGFCVLDPGLGRRNQHVASVVMGVQKSSWGRNIGSELLGHALEKAREAGIKRVELTVRTDNHAAIALYEKFGFIKEGVRAGSLLINGELRDEYFMARVG